MQLFRAALKRANNKQLTEWFDATTPVNPPPIASSRLFSAARFQAKLRAFNRLHDWPHSHLHPCFPQFLGLSQTIDALTHKHSPFPLMGLVHIENQFELAKPVNNDDMTIHCQFGAIQPHARGVAVDIEIKVFQAEQCCLSVISKYLYRIESNRVTAPKALSELSQMERLEEKVLLHFEESAGRRYARLSGDFNPIHLYKWSAQLFGFKTNIAHGMHVLALVLSKLSAEDEIFKKPCVVSNHFNYPVSLPGVAKLKCTTSCPDTEQPLYFQLHDPDASRRKQVVLNGKVENSVF